MSSSWIWYKVTVATQYNSMKREQIEFIFEAMNTWGEKWSSRKGEVKNRGEETGNSWKVIKLKKWEAHLTPPSPFLASLLGERSLFFTFSTSLGETRGNICLFILLKYVQSFLFVCHRLSSACCHLLQNKFMWTFFSSGHLSSTHPDLQLSLLVPGTCSHKGTVNCSAKTRVNCSHKGTVNCSAKRTVNC